MTLILYTTVGSSDLARSIKFYDSVFKALGVSRSLEWIETFPGWGPSYDGGVSFWVCKPFDGRAPAPANGTMVALRAAERG